MIDEKRLEGWYCDCEFSSDERTEVIRLARLGLSLCQLGVENLNRLPHLVMLGLWAKQVAVPALEDLGSRRLYRKPEDWDSWGMGGPPDVDDMETCTEIAEDALASLPKESST